MNFDLGFLGGGQLARMSIMAAQRMGLRCVSLDAAADTPASQVAPSMVGPLHDPEALASLIGVCARVTLENEFVPAAALRAACQAASRPEDVLVPGIDCLGVIQDKFLQREAYASAGVASPRAVKIEDDGTQAIAKIGFPMVLKQRFGGYDGKGTRTARTAEEFEDYRGLWDDGGWLAEQFVPFKRELAVMVFRSPDMVGTFPTMETVQSDHVCDLVFPSDVDASQIAIAAVEAVGGFGLFGVELFDLGDGTFSVNEIAPRPHNTGHFSLDWGGVSQFEQHVRLAMGLPCIPAGGFSTCMANLMGQAGAGDFRRGLVAALGQDPHVRVHWYGKSESRVGRKMGHLNVVGENAVERAKAARARFYAAWTSVAEPAPEIG
jgi:5-(carboxyamino)imidazole ribonucleotide synthase